MRLSSSKLDLLFGQQVVATFPSFTSTSTRLRFNVHLDRPRWVHHRRTVAYPMWGQRRRLRRSLANMSLSTNLDDFGLTDWLTDLPARLPVRYWIRRLFQTSGFFFPFPIHKYDTDNDVMLALWCLLGAGCGGTVFNTRGSVTSPGYPGNVSRTTDCQWELTVPLGMLIQIDFPGAFLITLHAYIHIVTSV